MLMARPGEVHLLPQNSKIFPPNIYFARYGTHGDGSCFFHAVCAAQNKDNYLHLPEADQIRIGTTFRHDIQKLVTDDVWEAFQKDHQITGTREMTPDAARKYFDDCRSWADERIIQFTIAVLKLNLIFFDESTNTLSHGIHGNAYDPMIIILSLGQAHFEAIGACRGVRNNENETGVQFVFDPINDANVVDYVMGAYREMWDVTPMTPTWMPETPGMKYYNE